MFFSLLDRLYKLDAEEKLQAITVASVPHMDSKDAKNVIRSYEHMSRDIMEVLEEDDNFDNLSKLKGKM